MLFVLSCFKCIVQIEFRKICVVYQYSYKIISYFDTPVKCSVEEKYDMINISLLFSVKPSKTTSFHQERH